MFGYPAGAHPDGNNAVHRCYHEVVLRQEAQRQVRLRAEVQGRRAVRLKCAFTAGADGGPLLIKCSNAKRIGFVNGVVSLAHDTDNNKRYDTISSPYFDGETATVYRAAANKWSGSIVSKDGVVIAN